MKRLTLEERVMRDDARSYVGCGNLKLGNDTLTFNMTPATDCPSRNLGLCKVGKKCYALKAEKTWKNVLPYRVKQSILWDVITAKEFVEMVLATRRKNIKYLRINEAGDFRCQADVEKLNVIAKELKLIGITTYLYTARTDLVFKDCEFVLNGSSWMADNEFRYIPKGTKPGLDVNFICPGDCRTCNLCKSKSGLIIGVEAH